MEESYFINHARARKFPFSIYHRPLEKDLATLLKTVVKTVKSPEILVIGGGLMHELDEMPTESRSTLIDIDKRALDAVQTKGDLRIKDYIPVELHQDLRTLGKTFDVIYAKEVIEHITDASEYLSQINHILKPGGFLWLSTPNYGEPWLPAIEKTFLEWVARRSGFTRKGIHPTRFSCRRLADMLKETGFKEIEVRPISKRLAIAAHARK